MEAGEREGGVQAPPGVTGKMGEREVAELGVQEGQQVRWQRLNVRGWALGERGGHLADRPQNPGHKTLADAD